MSDRRARSSKAAKALELTARLREQREGDKKRSRIDEAADEADAIENVYDELDEDAYRALVAKRREAGVDFVVNDAGEGYDDLGEEEDWTTANPNYSDDEEDAPKAKGAKATEKKAKATADEKAAKANAKAKGNAGMLLGGVQKKKKLDEVAADADADAILEDIFAEVDMFNASTPATVLARRAAPVAATAPVAPRRSPRKIAQATAAAANVRSPVKADPSPAKKSVRFETEEDEPAPQGDIGGFDDDDNDVDLDEAMPEVDPIDTDEPNYKSVEIAKAVQPPAPQSILKTLDEDEHEEDLATITQDAAPVTFNGVELPKDADGSIPFFFMDAHEERESPGTVFLFGRVRYRRAWSGDNQRLPVVQNMERCMYVIPTASTFDDPDDELMELADKMDEARRKFKTCTDADKLEEAKVAAQKAKADLMKRLVPKSGALRAEIKELLKKRGIENSKITIVRRHYCFERKDIPHGSLFVLKVKTPATQSAFPSDLKGTNFIAMMGTQAPMLELLTLKSKLKGPSWISLHGASIVPSEKQKSWCKLEMSIPHAHKEASRPASNEAATRSAPKLTVASLNLQTIVNHQTNVNEIALASVQYIRDVDCEGATAPQQIRQGVRHFSVVRKLDGLELPQGWQNAVANENSTNVVAKRTGTVVLSSQNNELGLLNFLLAKLHQLDPDVIVGHNIGGFNLDVLLRRFQANKIGH